MKHKELHSEKVRKVDAMYAHEVYDYLESKEVDGIREEIRKTVKAHGYLSAAQLARLVECPRKWSLLDIAATVKDVMRIKGYYVHYDQDATIKNLERSQYVPLEQEQYGRRCVYAGRRI